MTTFLTLLICACHETQVLALLSIELLPSKKKSLCWDIKFLFTKQHGGYNTKILPGLVLLIHGCEAIMIPSISQKAYGQIGSQKGLFHSTSSRVCLLDKTMPIYIGIHISFTRNVRSNLIFESKPFKAKMAYSLQNSPLSRVSHFQRLSQFSTKWLTFKNHLIVSKFKRKPYVGMSKMFLGPMDPVLSSHKNNDVARCHPIEYIRFIAIHIFISLRD